MSLKEYNKKRNFNKTDEPKGKVKKTAKNLRFVIQLHHARAKHYDFRLEYNGVLLSYAIPKGLSQNPKDKRLAVHVEDHPIDYINFEGIIPKGNYGAGSVEIYDKGNYFPLSDFETGLKKGHLKFVLNGKKFKGAWSLIKIDEKNWLIVKADDEFVIENNTKKTTLPFKDIRPQLATLSNKIPKGKDWLFEIKYDGYRIISYLKDDKIKMLSRNNIDYTKKFESLVQDLKQLGQENFVFDGEVVVFDKEGKSDFGLLQTNLKQKKNDYYYIIFDLLALNGEDYRNLPLIKRKEKLERLLVKSPKTLIYSTHIIDKGEECFKLAKEKNLEGIIAKKCNAPYIQKRTNDWLKIKCMKLQEFVVGGFTTNEKNKYISAILLGYYEDNKFKYVGKVGTGLTEEQKKKLNKLFKKYITNTSPFNDKLKEKNVVWLKPNLVAQIKYTELTKDSFLRHPSFVALRQDKTAKDVKLEVADD